MAKDQETDLSGVKYSDGNDPICDPGDDEGVEINATDSEAGKAYLFQSREMRCDSISSLRYVS